MIRILFYLLVLAAVAYGADWLLQRPGHIEIVWSGYHVTTSAAVGFALIVLAAAFLAMLWGILRFVFGLPSLVAITARHRRREKGYTALSRGLIAAGSGDARAANRASIQASKHLRNDPLALILRAQAARLSGDGAKADEAFGALAQRPETRLLGLRGLHDEAARRGDDEAARHFAGEAHQAKPLPWSAQTVLEHHAAQGQWEKALETVETSVSAGLVDRATGNRQRAVLETAIGLNKEATAPDAALDLARSAMKRAPGLVPPIVLAARLLTRRGDIRKAVRLIENAWPRCPHPELARAYLDVRPGDSTSDRLARAQTLMRISSFDPVSRLVVARAALAARNFAAARDAMAPLVAEGKRPSVRACLVMADLEDAEHGDLGHWREWLARASRAPLDPAWIADGIVYDQWQAVSPTTGRLDAFAWQAPADRPGHVMEAMPAPETAPRLGSIALQARQAEALPLAEPAVSSLPQSAKPAEVAEDVPLAETDAVPVIAASTMPAVAEPASEAPEDAGAAPLAGEAGKPAEVALAPSGGRLAIVAPDDPGVERPPEPSGRSPFQREEVASAR